MPMIVRRQYQRAFTLVELMVTVTVLVILLMVATPSFRDLIRRHQIDSANHALLAGLAYARTEAIMRAMFVSICPSADGQSCMTSTDYAQGWLIYAYPTTLGANSPYARGSNEFTLLRHASAHDGVAITASDNKRVTYGQQGQLKRSESEGPIRFTLCTAKAQNTAATPGSLIQVTGSGSASSRTLASGATCSSN